MSKEKWNQIHDKFFGATKNATKIQRCVLALVMLSLIGVGYFFGYTTGFEKGTGTFPFGYSTSRPALPPQLKTAVTSQEVEVAATKAMDLTPIMGQDFNCVEGAFVAARQFWWEGYEATVIKLDFYQSSIGHMLVGVPTDEGWRFYNPEQKLWVEPRVGGMFMDKRIKAMSYLYDFMWRPVDVPVTTTVPEK